ncbi:acyl-phosphate glycerol 3-phosphate acyltransferase [Bacillus sp. V3-13]|uniref:glycerol-3-phosphate 1-O-acyltransferase PlsY n=1 Tax=Bacillus sp. V3-13 TaxID=2053728 RepID=UPI000C776850|nr:glycerol-3-phosphate 1-O-acyltransferase PlsY [Bacillus sp. V3-13]PLR75676.1 acyl-phosphate glycerol 3-phosphate acyltransferase [Bacillus sp. V3-13]
MIVLFGIIAYLLGSIPTALLIGKWFFKIDIRDYGSNNPGATNTFRVLGKKAAVVVLLIDVGKGAAAALIPTLFAVEADPLYMGLIAVIGHCFPIFAGFRGGKAIATTAGALLVANAWMFLTAYIAFFLTIAITKYVFFGSLSVGISLFIYSIMERNVDHSIIFALFSLFLLFLHRTNICNFIDKKEPKINDKNLRNDRIDSLAKKQ